MSFSRRNFVQALGLSLLTPFTLRSLASDQSLPYAEFILGTAPSNLAVDETGEVFDLSVSSGDPSISGVVLWTHINPNAYVAGQALFLQVSLDQQFNDVFLTSEIASQHISLERDLTVNVDLDGYLNSDSQYYYRFVYGDKTSRTGRCHTLPTGNIDKLKMAVVTCQDYTTGFYNAYNHIANEDIQFVIHLGDFIYEYAQYEGFEDQIVHPMTLPSGEKVAMDLADYRYIYNNYRRDKNLQRAMENHTFIVTWDDHETGDNAYWDYERDTLGAPYHPYTTDARFNNDPELLRQLRRDAQQAWIEYVPARVKIDENASHAFDYLSLYRSFKFGELLELFMTDSRSYRTKEPCKDGNAWQNYWCTDYEKQSQTMLGETQRDWLIDGITTSDATWKLWGNQTLLAQLAATVAGVQTAYASYDAWDGFQWEREKIMSEIKDKDISNFVVITGDLHTSLSSYLKVNYRNINNWDYSNLVGIELMTPAISSPNLQDTVDRSIDVGNVFKSILNGGVQINNPHIKDFNSAIYGYAVIEFNNNELLWTVYDIDKKSDNPNTSKNTYKTFHYEPKEMWLTEQ
jgi:alkaline phosphatase D